MLIVKPTKPTYTARRASLDFSFILRRIKADKPSKWAGWWMVVIGLLIMLIPAILGLKFISPLGAVIWVVLGLCWLIEGIKTLKECAKP